MPWIADPVIPQCPCGANAEHQVMRCSSGSRMYWFCLCCQAFREPPTGWSYTLRAVDTTWLRADHARRRRLAAERDQA